MICCGVSPGRGKGNWRYSGDGDRTCDRWYEVAVSHMPAPFRIGPMRELSRIESSGAGQWGSPYETTMSMSQALLGFRRALSIKPSRCSLSCGTGALDNAALRNRGRWRSQVHRKRATWYALWVSCTPSNAYPLPSWCWTKLPRARASLTALLSLLM